MYIVVSEWEPLPGKEAEFNRVGMAVANVLRSQPGVVLLEGFESGGKRLAVHVYHDEATYRALVHDPNGVFARAIAEHKLEEVARWVRSESGEAIAH